ncbi:hypothetical protein [Hasllibacter sp. MH4015]|uniref:hypothetical protein n=1 Tax=Hasllibacter sp. MH4015 TaxID=2854029 RepID=UPI001CD4A009|nr:hypothetical protein [Hasllibacter sp. MH4015]
MIAPFTSVKNSTLQAKAGTFGINDLMFDPDSLAVEYAVLEGGGWVTNTDVLVHAKRLRAFDEGTRTWTADVSEGDLANAPRLGSDNVVDLSALPPVIVGPFGMTYSPILMAAQFLGYPVTKDRPTRDAVDQLDRMSDWLGSVVFNGEGPIARIVDLFVDAETMRLTEVEFAMGAEKYVLPVTAIRTFVRGDGYAICDLTEAEIEQGFTAAEPGPALPKMPKERWVQTAA